jgi:protein-disulfide isomerase/uncharacterized membrane protein
MVVRLLAVLVSMGGLGLSYKLAIDHVKDVLKIERERTSILDEACISAPQADCDEVSMSRWGVFPFGSKPSEPHIPTAELGFWFFAAMLCWFALIGDCTPSRWWAHLIVLAGAGVGLGSSIFFEIIMWTQLDKWCPLCLATHIATLLLLVFALLLWPRRPRPEDEVEAPAEPREDWPHWWMLAVTPLVAVLLAFCGHLLLTPVESVVVPVASKGMDIPPELVAARSSDQGNATQPADQEEVDTSDPEALAGQVKDLRTKLKAAEWYRDYWKKQFEKYDRHWQLAFYAWMLTPAVDISLEGEPKRGATEGAHTLVVYSDFQCPHCREFEEYLSSTIVPLGTGTGGLTVVFKHWPICTDCNPHAQANRHPMACQASRALEAARIVGGDSAYWKMHDLLWARQADWKDSGDFTPLAEEIGLEREAFLKAMASDKALERIKANIEEGATLGKGVLSEDDYDLVRVDSTPAVFVDGKRVWRMHKKRAMWQAMLMTKPRDSQN